MVMHNLPKREWKSYFEAMSNALIGKWAEVEVASLDLGDQIVAEWIPLLGITYDDKDDLVDVSLGGERQLNHLIRRPTQIEILDEPDGLLRSISIATGDGTVQVLKLKDPLRLPPATQGEAQAVRKLDSIAGQE